MTNILTPANQLTLLRLLLVPVFVICMLYDLPGWALVTFAAAGVSSGSLSKSNGSASAVSGIDVISPRRYCSVAA